MEKEAYYFSHDSNALCDPKILAMLSVYGMEGYGMFWAIVELMRQQADYRLSIAGKYSYHSYARHLQCDCEKLKQFISDCRQEFGLFESDGESIWSPSLLRRMSEKDKRTFRAKAAAAKRWGHEEPNQPENEDFDADAMPTQCSSNADAPKIDALKERKGKEIKGKENKELREKPTPLLLQIDELSKVLNIDPKFSPVWSNWTESRKEAKKPLTPRMIHGQYQKLVRIRDPEQRRRCVENSIANGYTGIFEDKFIEEPRRSIRTGFKSKDENLRHEQYGKHLQAKVLEAQPT